jgi:thioredoxin reductase (NADPH)
VTILCRGDALEKRMSRYLIDQLATRSNIEVRFGTEVAAVHGDSSLEAIDVRGSATERRTSRSPNLPMARQAAESTASPG